MIDIDIIYDAKDLLDYVSDELKERITKDGQKQIHPPTLNDVHLKCLKKNRVVGVVKYSTMDEYGYIQQIHPMFRAEHRFYARQCIEQSTKWLRENTGTEVIIATFPENHAGAERMALSLGCEYVETMNKNPWVKNGRKWPLMIYKLGLYKKEGVSHG